MSTRTIKRKGISLLLAVLLSIIIVLIATGFLFGWLRWLFRTWSDPDEITITDFNIIITDANQTLYLSIKNNGDKPVSRIHINSSEVIEDPPISIAGFLWSPGPPPKYVGPLNETITNVPSGAYVTKVVQLDSTWAKNVNLDYTYKVSITVYFANGSVKKSTIYFRFVQEGDYVTCYWWWTGEVYHSNEMYR